MRAVYIVLLLVVVTAGFGRVGAGVVLHRGHGDSNSLPGVWRGSFLAPNGTVDALALSDRTLYLGGGFSELTPLTGSFAVLARSSGRRDRAFPRVAGGDVSAIASDGRGGWFIGGRFEAVGGVDCPRLAHVRADRTVSRAWCPRPNGTVSALLVSAGRLYVGGRFTYIGATKRSALAALDASTGAVTRWNPRPRAKGDLVAGVNALVLSGSVLYAGGFFSVIGGAKRDSLAALDLSSGRATTWNPKLEAPSYRVSSRIDAIAVADSTVYLGGDFKGVNGMRRNNLAAVDRITGEPSGWNPRPNLFGVQTILPSGSSVYLGGDFTRVGGRARSSLAAVDRRTGGATRWNPRIGGGGVAVLAISGSTLYAGGDFERVGGRKRSRLAAIDAGTGRALGWDPHVSAGEVVAFALAGSRVAVGGDFSSLGRGVPRANVAALDAATGRHRPWSVKIGGCSYQSVTCVSALALSGTTLYLGGSFSHVGGRPRSGLAAVDATTGRVKSWNPSVKFFFDGVETLAVLGSTVYVGGSFERVGGRSRNSLAAVDATTGRVLPWNPKPEGFESVGAIVVAGSTIYVGGRFDRIGGQERHGLAVIDATTGRATGWNPNPTNSTVSLFLVKALAVSGSTVYVGGRFRSIGGTERTNLAAVDATTGRVLPWNPNPGPWNPDPDRGPVDDVEALAVSASTLYAGGRFDSIGDRPRRIAAIDLTSGSVKRWDPEVRGTGDVLTLVASRSAIYAGGGFEGSVAAFPLSP